MRVNGCLLSHGLAGRGQEWMIWTGARLKAWEAVRDAGAQVVHSVARDLPHSLSVGPGLDRVRRRCAAERAGAALPWR